MESGTCPRRGHSICGNFWRRDGLSWCWWRAPAIWGMNLSTCRTPRPGLPWRCWHIPWRCPCGPFSIPLRFTPRSTRQCCGAARTRSPAGLWISPQRFSWLCPGRRKRRKGRKTGWMCTGLWTPGQGRTAMRLSGSAPWSRRARPRDTMREPIFSERIFGS